MYQPRNFSHPFCLYIQKHRTFASSCWFYEDFQNLFHFGWMFKSNSHLVMSSLWDFLTHPTSLGRGASLVDCKEYKLHYKSSMMSQGKTPWKDPPRPTGVTGVRGVYPRGLSLGHHRRCRLYILQSHIGRCTYLSLIWCIFVLVL